jgi:hypothetical protein
MVRVRLSTSFPGWPLARQTPGSSASWGPYRFFIDQPIDECDWWVIYQGPLAVERTRCPPGNTLFISSEPPSLDRYSRSFLKQFSTVITCQRRVRHPDVRLTQQALPWHIGAYHQCPGKQPLTYDDFKALAVEKTRCLSVVSSSKTLTRGHRLRLRFVQELQRRLKDKVDVFGRGIRDIDDKWEAIAPYRYHISIENSSVPHYWTEKLSDAYLGGALPFYHGCPNINDYFAHDALVPIDITDPRRSIDSIEAAIESSAFERAQPALTTARNQVLDQYNLFPMLARVFSEPRDASPLREVEIFPRTVLRSLGDRLLTGIARSLPAPIKRLLK